MRKSLMFILSVIMFVAYILIVDPYTDVNLLANIPYGVELVFLVKTFLMIFVLVTMMNLFTDQALDSTYGYDESVISKKAMESAEGAGYLMISRSLRYIAIAILIFGILYFTKDSTAIYVNNPN